MKRIPEALEFVDRIDRALQRIADLEMDGSEHGYAKALGTCQGAAQNAQAELADLRLLLSSAQDDGSMLRLDRDGGGLRHFLNDKPVYAGAGLELLASEGQPNLRGHLRGHWIPVRYEWSFREDQQPMLYTDEGHMFARKEDRFRWPVSPSNRLTDLFGGKR